MPMALIGILLLIVVLTVGCSSATHETQSQSQTRPPASLVADFENALARKLLDETYSQLLTMPANERYGHAVTRLKRISNSTNPDYLSDTNRVEIAALSDYASRENELRQFGELRSRQSSTDVNVPLSSLPQGAAYYSSWIETLTGMSPAEVHRMGIAEVHRLSELLKHVGKPATPVTLPNTEAGRQAYLDRVFDSLNTDAFTHEVLAELTVQGVELGGELFHYADNTLFIDLVDMDLLPLYEIPSQVRYHVIPGLHLASLFPGSAVAPDRQAMWAGYMACQMCTGATPESAALRFHIASSALLVTDTGIHATGWNYEQGLAYLVRFSSLNDARAKRHLRQIYLNPGHTIPPVIGRLRIQEKLKQLPAEIQRKIYALLRDAGPLPLEKQLQIIDTRLP